MPGRAVLVPHGIMGTPFDRHASRRPRSSNGLSELGGTICDSRRCRGIRRRPRRAAAALIRADPGKAWTLQQLAISSGAPQGRLSRQFKKVFGVRPAAYVHLVRISQAVALFRTSAKVEAIARDVGYRSKKDFYAALKRWVGLTPAELRELNDEESRWLVRTLRQRCLPSTGDRQPSSVFAHEPAGTPACRQPLLRRRSAQPPHR